MSQLDELFREVFTGDFYYDPARESYPGYRLFGNVEVISWGDDVRTYETKNMKYGQADDVKQFPIARWMKVRTDKIHYQNSELARGISAADETAGVSAEVTDEIVSMDNDHTMKLGWHKLVHGSGAKSPNSLVVCWSAAAKTGIQSIEGTDFYFDYALGRAARIIGGNITDGQDVYFSYKYTTQDFKVIKHSQNKINTKGRYKYVHKMADATNDFIIEIPLGYISEVGDVKDEEDPRTMEITIRSLRKESETGQEHGTTKFGQT